MTVPNRGSRALRAAFTYYQKIQCVLVALIFLITAACVMPRRPPGTQSPSPGSGNGPAIGPASCSAGEEWCEGRCMSPGDFIGNDSNCGRCGNRCSFNESCSGTSCSCAAGYTSCMGQCVSSSSFISDNSNCGSCGHSCSIGESCTGGTCMKIGH